MTILALAKKVLKIESQAILSLESRIDEKFLKAAEMISQVKGKVIFSGIGKSGLIARKTASTMSSTGTPSLFLHPSESSHGDMGVISENDLLIAYSYSGESTELVPLIHFCARRGIPVIAMTGKPSSTLAQAAQVVLDISVGQEACPLNLAPTASTTATLAMGDALAMTVLQMKGFSADDFSEYHPGGQLGAKLLTRVEDLMHKGEALPLVSQETPLREVFSIMTHREVRGVAGVINAHKELVGVITDGDIRRRLEKNGNPFEGTAKELMNQSPRTIASHELAERALYMMEQFKIQTLFVIDSHSTANKVPVGVLNYQDLLKAKIK